MAAQKLTILKLLNTKFPTNEYIQEVFVFFD
jgi:hypothetical protein